MPTDHPNSDGQRDSAIVFKVELENIGCATGEYVRPQPSTPRKINEEANVAGRVPDTSFKANTKLNKIDGGYFALKSEFLAMNGLKRES